MRLCMLAAALLLAAAPSVRAARGNASVAAALSDSAVDAGEQTQYQISVTNGDLEGPPRTPAVDGLTINYAGRSSSTQYSLTPDGFAQTTTTTYVFTVETNKPGRYTIPGQEVRTDSGALRTLPVTLTVLGQGGGNGTSGQNARVYAELILAKKIAYLGESVPMEVHACYVVNALRNIDPDPILSGDGFSVQRFALPRGAGQSTPDGRYNVDVYKSAVAGLKLGLLTVGPVTLMPKVQLPRASGSRRRTSNDPFDMPFGPGFDPYNMGPIQYVKIQSEPVALEIKPLPEAGKPTHFSGAIGQFKITAEAVPNKAQTGDPVTIRLRLSGQGNFDRITPPTLSDDTGLRTYPPTAKFKADDEVGLSGVQTVEQVVIAEGPRTTLPSYHFNYLDPATGKYVTVDTLPLPVKIEGRNLATPIPAPVASAVGTPAPGPTPTPMPTPHRAPEDILYIRADAGQERGKAAFLPIYRQTGFWVVQGGILAAVLALGGTMGWRTRRADEANRRAARLARQQGDQQRALRREDTGRREFYKAATRLGHLRVGAENASLSAAEIARAKGLDPKVAGSVQEIFERHEELAYSGAAAAESPVPAAERRDVLATLETIGRS